MKKTKILSLVLAVALVVSAFCMTSIVASAASGNCGANVTWNLSASGALTISGSGAMTNYASADATPWVKEDVKSVSIGSNVTTIGDYAFYGCNNLTSVSIASTVTSIGANAFRYCDSLTSISIPSSVKTIGDFAFGWCVALNNVTLSSGLQSIGKGAFYYCGNLSSIAIPATVTSFGEDTFLSCRNIMEVEIPEGVATIPAGMFESCVSLKKVTIPSTVTSVGNDAFLDCEALADVYFAGSNKSQINLGNNTLLNNVEWHYSSSPTPGSGVTVSGTVTTKSTVHKTDATTVSLMQGNAVVKSTTVSGISGSYSFTGVAAGSYTVKFERPYHAARSYTVTVSSANVTVDGEIRLVGDGNNDGVTSSKDLTKLKKHLSKPNLSGYDLDLYDLNGDKTVSSKDLTRLKKHVAGSSLY